MTDVVPAHAPTPNRGFLQRRNWSAGSYNPRFEAVRAELEGRDVLDLGCSSGHWRDDWLHGRIAQISTRAVGLDLDQEAVDALSDRGFDIRLGNAESFELDERFDVVFAGELIEHLQNTGGMLNSAARHLRPDGLLVLTTPNAFGFTNFVYRLRGQPRVNDDHTCWFCEDTLRQLLEKTGYEVRDIRYLHYEAPGRVRGLLARIVRRVLPERLAWSTLIAVAAPVVTLPE